MSSHEVHYDACPLSHGNVCGLTHVQQRLGEGRGGTAPSSASSQRSRARNLTGQFRAAAANRLDIETLSDGHRRRRRDHPISDGRGEDDVITPCRDARAAQRMDEGGARPSKSGESVTGRYASGPQDRRFLNSPAISMVYARIALTMFRS